MEEITHMIEEGFAGYPDTSETTAAKKAVTQRLETVYQNAQGGQKSGYEQEWQLQHIIQDACLGENIEGELLWQRLLLSYAKFQKKYPVLIRWGFLAILFIPLVFLVLMFSLESKLVCLTLWIISMITIAAYLITVEYMDYHYQRLLHPQLETKWKKGGGKQ